MRSRQNRIIKDRTVIVVPSKTIPQGITAIINHAPDLPVEDNLKRMEQEMARVKSGQVTYAVRNTSIDGREITEGDIMGIGDNGILAVGQKLEVTAFDTLSAMLDEESEFVTVYYGQDVKPEEAEAFCTRARHAFPECEIECHSGGQPIYYYMISVE